MKIPQADVLAALARAVSVLAQTSESHAVEIGSYIHASFQPNPILVPGGVAMMFAQGQIEFEALMGSNGWGQGMINVSTNLVLAELRKLPGVDDIFIRFEASQKGC